MKQFASGGKNRMELLSGDRSLSRCCGPIWKARYDGSLIGGVTCNIEPGTGTKPCRGIRIVKTYTIFVSRARGRARPDVRGSVRRAACETRIKSGLLRSN